MLYINHNIKDGARYPDDFSMLKNGAEFAIEKRGSDYYVQTILSDIEKITDLIKEHI